MDDSGTQEFMDVIGDLHILPNAVRGSIMAKKPERLRSTMLSDGT